MYAVFVQVCVYIHFSFEMKKNEQTKRKKKCLLNTLLYDQYESVQVSIFIGYCRQNKMSIPGSISTNTNLSRTIMNNNLHQQQFLFDQLSKSIYLLEY